MRSPFVVVVVVIACGINRVFVEHDLTSDRGYATQHLRLCQCRSVPRYPGRNNVVAFFKLTILLSNWPSILLSACPPACHPSARPSVRLSVRQPAHPSISPLVSLPAWLSFLPPNCPLGCPAYGKVLRECLQWVWV